MGRNRMRRRKNIDPVELNVNELDAFVIQRKQPSMPVNVSIRMW